MRKIEAQRPFTWLAIVLGLAGTVCGSSGPRYPLEQAAFVGDVEQVKNLLADGPDQFRQDSALGFAIQAGHRDVMELLISHGARYALVKAAEKGDIDLVKHLLARDQEAKDRDSAFFAAVRMQHRPIAESLLAHGADVNVRRWFGLTPLCVAAVWEGDMTSLTRWPNEITPRQAGGARNAPGAVEMVTFLLEHGADINAVGDPPGLVPLHYAIHGGNEKIVEMLLAHGAQVNPKIRAPWLPSHFTTPLHLATEYGDRAICELLIQHGAEVNVPLPAGHERSSHTYQTPLHHAAESGNAELVELLLDHGADINGVDSRGNTALHDAIQRKKRGVVEILLGRGAAVNIATERGQTPLHYAAQYEDETAVKLLLARGAKADAKDSQGQTPISIAVGKGNNEIVSMLTAQTGQATLHAAASMGDIDTMARLVDGGTDINRIDVQGRTALHAAVRAGQTEAVDWLLTHGADADWLDDQRMGPLTIALRIAQHSSFSRDPNEVARFNALKRKQQDILPLLVAAGAHPDFRYGLPRETVLAHPERIAQLLVEAGLNLEPYSDEQATLLHRAAWWGRERVVAELLELGADVHAVDRMGGTPLHAAVHRGSTRYWDVVSGPHADVVQLLLDHGADANAANNDGITPLGGATGGGDPNAVALLMQYGADDNMTDEAGRTLLHQAAERGSIEGMASLMAQGADPNVADKEGDTPLHLLLADRRWVREEKKPQVIDYVTKLVRAGVRVDVQNQEGITLLHQTAALGSWPLLEEMLRRGARVNAQSASGWTALHSAVAGGYTECVVGLLRHGADVTGFGSLPDMVCLAQHYKPARPPLQIAASGGHDDIIRRLVASGADIEAADSDGKTALYLAYEQNHPSTFKLLLDCGADPDVRTPGGTALVYRVAARQRGKMVAALLQRIDPGRTELIRTLAANGTTPLHEAAREGNLARVAELIADGMDVNIPDRRGSHPIHLAHAEGHIEIVKLLLPKTPPSVLTDLLFQETKGDTNEMIALLISQGADADAIDVRRGDSLLHRFVWQGNRDMIEFLLTHGANVNVLPRIGETPLSMAVRRGRSDIVTLLLSRGADVNIAPTDQAYNGGWTPLYHALNQDHVEIAEKLVKAGANLDIRPKPAENPLLHMALDHQALFELMLAHGGQIDIRLRNGATLLHQVAERGDAAQVQYLIDKGAAVDAQDNRGETPLHRAARKGHGAVCRTLINNQADITIRNKQGRLARDYAIAAGLDNLLGELTP